MSSSWAQQLSSLSYYYLGLPRPDVPDHRIFWSHDKQLGQLLRMGRPVVVAMLVPG